MGTITKALNLLNYFSETAPELGLMEFKKLSGQDKATVHRHLTELTANGFLEQNPETRKYRLGAAILRLSAVRERTFPARRIVAHWVKELACQVEELVHASLIQGSRMSSLCFHDGRVGGTRVYFSEADMLPMHATASGLSALAFGPPDILKKVLARKLESYTEYTPTDPQALLAKVEEARRKGYAVSNQTYEREVCSVSAPFFENSAKASGAISVAIPATRIDETKINEVARHLWQISDAVSDQLGGAVPQEFRQHMARVS
ncbi:MAG: IclR family transcriptional regulator [Pseudomonadota bacterium]